MPSSDQRHGDSGSQSVDDQFRALMEGLRTTLPGAQVLFGFLLALPLQSDFSTLRPIDRITYGIAFLAAALSSILLIAPSAHQRVRALQSGVPRRTQSHLTSAVRITVVGTVTLLVAIVASVYLVASVEFGSVGAGLALAAVAGVGAWTWFWMPLVAFRSDDRTR